MKQLLMVQQSKLLSSVESNLNKSELAFYWMWLPFLWVFKLQEEWWQSLFLEILLFQLKNHKSLQLMLITNLVFVFKFSRDKDKWQKITICLENSIWMEYHLHQEESLKSKSVLKLMQMELWMSLLLTKELWKMQRSQSPITRAVFLSRRLKDYLKKPKSSKIKTKKWEEKYRLVML